DDLPRALVERLEPAANTHLAAGITDEHFPFHHEGRHGDRLADVDVTDLGVPHRFSRRSVESDGVIVEGVEKQSTLIEHQPAIHDITAGDSLRRELRLWIVLPFDGESGLGEIERKDDVGKWRDDIHRAADNEGRRFMPLRYSGGERGDRAQVFYIGGIDLRERAEAGRGKVLRGTHPLSVVRR